MDTGNEIRSGGLSGKGQIMLMIVLALVVCLNLAVILSGLTYLHLKSVFSVEYEAGSVVSFSPDSRHKLVINEWTYGLGGGADLYIKSPDQDEEQEMWGRKYIATVGTNNGYNSFSKGYYHVEWEEDQVTVRYYKNLKGENKNDSATWQGLLTYEME